MRRPVLSEHDRAIWANYVRAIAPMPGRARPDAPPMAAPLPTAVSAAVAPIPPSPRRAALAPLLIGQAPPGLDGATWQKLRAGKLAPTRTLDLHGRTAQRSYNLLVAWLRAAHGDGTRCVDIITGRGSGEGGGVLRRELPLWLNLPDLRPLALAAVHPHANPGAVRLLLRRRGKGG